MRTFRVAGQRNERSRGQATATRNDRRRVGSKSANSFSVSRSSFFDQSAPYLNIDRCIRPPVRVATSKKTSSRPEIFQSGTGKRPVELRRRRVARLAYRAASLSALVLAIVAASVVSRWRVIPRECVFVLFAARYPSLPASQATRALIDIYTAVASHDREKRSDIVSRIY